MDGPLRLREINLAVGWNRIEYNSCEYRRNTMTLEGAERGILVINLQKVRAQRILAYTFLLMLELRILLTSVAVSALV